MSRVRPKPRLGPSDLRLSSTSPQLFILQILQIVSSTWTCAHQLQHEIDRLSSHYPISTSLSKDQASLIVETSLLFIKPKSKVRVKAICERESLFSISQDGGFDLKDGVASFVPGKVVVESVYGKAE